MNPEKPTGGEGQEFVAGTNEYAELGNEKPSDNPPEQPPQNPEPETQPENIADGPWEHPDWIPTKQIANEISAPFYTLRRAYFDNKDTLPGETEELQVGKQLRMRHSPDRAEALKHLVLEATPDTSLISLNALSKEIGVAPRTIHLRLQKAGREPIRLRGRGGKGGQSDYLSPEDQAYIRELFPPREKISPPPLWKTLQEVANETGQEPSNLHQKFKLIREKLSPEETESNVGKFPRNGQFITFISPEIQARLAPAEKAEGGWIKAGDLVKQTGASLQQIKRLGKLFEKDNPGNFGLRRFESSPAYAASPDAADFIASEVIPGAPENWKTTNEIAKSRGTTHYTVAKAVESLRSSMENHYRNFAAGTGGGEAEYYSPEFQEKILELLDGPTKNKQELLDVKALEANAESHIAEIARGETLEAQEFLKLTSLFGSEYTIDLLYLHHPEYKKIPVPYLRSILPDYLGEFIVLKGELDLETLEKNVVTLIEPNLQESLQEVIKDNALHYYNEHKRQNPVRDDKEILTAYTAQLREKTARFTTEQLEEVIGNVDQFYQSLFEIQLPDNVVDQLNPERSFPDINQRINIKEIGELHKMLIADEMGVGKSASAILAKECLGVKQALVVVPSNVIPVWQRYLSDQRSESGEPVGYFKDGQAPKVLTIEEPGALAKVDPSEFDYVILSQERLNDRYADELAKLNYDMLIVDEMHKLKNISEGVRAENLVKLAERINGGGEQQYLALLSGTPVPNKVGDVAMTLKLLYPDRFKNIPNKQLTNQILHGDLTEIRSLLAPRMEMKSLGESLPMPHLEERFIPIKPSKREQEFYDVLLDQDELTASEKLQILRQFELNPEMLDTTPGLESAKIRAASSALRDSFVTKDKVVMFVNGYVEGVIRGEHNIIDKLDIPAGVEVMTIEGEVGKDERNRIQADLQQSGKQMLVLVSGQTADVGVDFSGAQEVFFYNEPWTEYDRRQQLGRVYRPGLKDDLTVTTFYVEGTIEEGIHHYIKEKYHAVEKLLRGIPLSAMEQSLLEHEEPNGPNLEIHPEFAKYWQSSRNNLLKFYGHVKGRSFGEDEFKHLLTRYGELYADSYVEVGSRSYQANASRLAATVIDSLAEKPAETRILDIASGPEMLKQHISEDLAEKVVSIDINAEHFKNSEGKAAAGSFLNLPIKNSSVDFASLSLALHYTSFLPSKQRYERIQVFQEINRVLKTGGKTVISLIDGEDIADVDTFNKALGKCGFKPVEQFSGEASAGNYFKSRLITLEKVSDCPTDLRELLKALGPEGIQSFKPQAVKSTMRNTYKIATGFNLGSKRIKAKLNQADQAVLDEEKRIEYTLQGLKSRFGGIAKIPAHEILMHAGVARVKAGKNYLLFRRLESASGAVVIR